MIKHLIAFVLVFLFLFSVGSLAENSTPLKEIVHYQYASSFDVALYDIEGNEVVLPNMPSLIVYGSDDCKTSLAITSQLQQAFEVLGDEFVQIYIVWQDVIPTDHIEKNNLPIEKNLTLAGKAEIGGNTPSVFIVDSEGVVQFRDTDMKRAIERLLSMNYYPEGYLIERADPYLLSKMNDSGEKIPLLYFKMTGCPDCFDADLVLQEDSRIDELFSFDSIHRFNETDPEKWTDYFSLFTTIYGVTWFPSYLVFNDGISVLIGQVPLEELCDSLVDAVENP